MSELSSTVPYRVSYSGRVQRELKELLLRAKGVGRGQEFLDAAREIDRRLSIYPQFGEPLRQMKHLPGVIWIGVVPPLVVQYAIDEEKRLVMVGVPILPLTERGL